MHFHGHTRESFLISNLAEPCYLSLLDYRVPCRRKTINNSGCLAPASSDARSVEACGGERLSPDWSRHHTLWYVSNLRWISCKCLYFLFRITMNLKWLNYITPARCVIQFLSGFSRKWRYDAKNEQRMGFARAPRAGVGYQFSLPLSNCTTVRF